MKTVQFVATKEIERLSNKRAEELIRLESVRYVPKSMWKSIQKSKIQSAISKKEIK